MDNRILWAHQDTRTRLAFEDLADSNGRTASPAKTAGVLAPSSAGASATGHPASPASNALLERAQTTLTQGQTRQLGKDLAHALTTALEAGTHLATLVTLLRAAETVLQKHQVTDPNHKDGTINPLRVACAYGRQALFKESTEESKNVKNLDTQPAAARREVLAGLPTAPHGPPQQPRFLPAGQ